MTDDPDHLRKYGATDMSPVRKDRPHIRLIRAYWCVFKNRQSHNPIGLTSKFAKLRAIGPWRPEEIQCEFYGDSKPS